MFTHKTWTPPLSTCNPLTIIKNGLKMRKLQPPKVKGIKNTKKQTSNNTKADFWTANFFYNVTLLLLEVKDDL